MVPDVTWQRWGSVLLAGSPLTKFRVTDAGERVLEAIERGDEIDDSRLLDRLLDAGAAHPAARPSGRYGHADVVVVTPQLGGAVSCDGRIVVDDGSQPPLAGAAHRLAVNRGPAAARNAGRALATAPLIAFVDADVDLLDQLGGGSWLSRLLCHFDDPTVGAVAPRVTGEAGSSLDLGDAPARVRAGTRVGYVPAAALVVRAEAFDSVGGFDETLRFGEDVDLVWRLDDAGWHVRYEPGSVVWHEPRPTPAARWRQQAGYGSSAAPLALRHPRALAPWRGGVDVAVTSVALGVGAPLAALTLGALGVLRTTQTLAEVPRRNAATLAISGHLAAAGHLARAMRRVWWPLLLIGAVVSRRSRVAFALAALVAPSEVVRDLAYSTGVWRGVFRHRTVLPLVPAVTRRRR